MPGWPICRRRKLAVPHWRKALQHAASLQVSSCQYVYKRYGELGAALTADVIT